MNFTSFEFIIFFAVVFLGWALLKNKGTIYTVFMLCASYYFYMSWNPKFILLILFSTIVDYFIGPLIYNTKKTNYRKLYLGISLLTNLGLLFFFKYTNFIIDNLSALLLYIQIIDLPLAHYSITLPVGISFYTFQTLSYSIDIYRHKLKPEKRFLNFALFVAFFPQLVAGPIVRASEMLPQLSRKLKLEWHRLSEGMWLIVLGFYKKIYLSGNLAPFSDNVFKNPAIWSSFEIWMGVIAYSLQIYCDFSGYSDIAIGLAKVMGYDLPKNFNMPYAAKSITDFWRRWHISLSTWLRDYLYIPLGGSRNGTLVMVFAIMATMGLGGLWHGASWNFFIWGILHGTYLLMHKLWCYIKIKMHLDILNQSIIWKITSNIITFLCAVIAFIFFRADSTSIAVEILNQLYAPLHIPETIYQPFFFIITIIIIAHIFGSFYQKAWQENKLIDHRRVFIIFMILSLICLAPNHSSPFIYFQF